MTYETAHKILSAHHALRRGLVDAMEYTAADLTKALEVAITALQADHDAPDWSKAPRWAQWYATDADGSSLWYEHEPKLKFNALYRKEKGISMLSENLKRVKLYKRPEQ